MQIRNRWTGAVIFEDKSPTLRETVLNAISKGASLDGASLNDASLDGASLNRASLNDASLNDASLDGASLNDASLNRASLNRASLNGASLNDASLDGAYLANAKGLPYEPRPDSVVPYSRPPTDQTARIERYRMRHPEVPVVLDLDRKILEAIESGGKLEMASWHTCETTHCRAGWAIHLAGEAGRELEKKLGSQRAGGLIYKVSTGRLPHFFASNERALADIKACAAQSEQK